MLPCQGRCSGFDSRLPLTIMYNHAPKDYTCPICLAINGVESKDTMILQDDIFYRDDLVIALINSKFVKNNSGHAIIVPLKHYENIYDLPEVEAKRIIQISKQVALAIKKIRNCDGITILQNNEPAGGQHAFHYHMHIFPRFKNDNLEQHLPHARLSKPEERRPYFNPLKTYFEKMD